MGIAACTLVGLLVAASPRTAPRQDEAVAPRSALEGALRCYFADERADGAALQAVLAAAKGREALLVEVLKTKSFVAPCAAVAQHGSIDARGRWLEVARAGEAADNAALFFGPAASGALVPLVVYVPDRTTTAGSEAELEEDGTRAGRFVLLVPDDKQDDRWNPTPEEHRRHVGPLRDLLLNHPIDPDRVYMVGSGRGGHATWDVGLTYPDRFAGLSACNGTPLHEGGFKASGGVFLENGRSLAIFAAWNTTFDHGIEGCRYAARKFKEWGCRFAASEEKEFRTMRIGAAMVQIDGVVRDPHPRAIVKRWNHLDAAEHYWLRGLDRVPHEWDPAAVVNVKEWPSDPAKQHEVVWEQVKLQCARFEGSIRDNRITVTTQGIGRLRVWFDPELVDEKRPVVVVLNGAARPPVRVERSAAVMLQHVHETGDTARLYWSCHDFAVTP